MLVPKEYIRKIKRKGFTIFLKRMLLYARVSNYRCMLTISAPIKYHKAFNRIREEIREIVKKYSNEPVLGVIVRSDKAIHSHLLLPSKKKFIWGKIQMLRYKYQKKLNTSLNFHLLGLRVDKYDNYFYKNLQESLDFFEKHNIIPSFKHCFSVPKNMYKLFSDTFKWVEFCLKQNVGIDFFIWLLTGMYISPQNSYHYKRAMYLWKYIVEKFFWKSQKWVAKGWDMLKIKNYVLYYIFRIIQPYLHLDNMNLADFLTKVAKVVCGDTDSVYWILYGWFRYFYSDAFKFIREKLARRALAHVMRYNPDGYGRGNNEYIGMPEKTRFQKSDGFKLRESRNYGGDIYYMTSYCPPSPSRFSTCSSSSPSSCSPSSQCPLSSFIFSPLIYVFNLVENRLFTLTLVDKVT